VFKLITTEHKQTHTHTYTTMQLDDPYNIESSLVLVESHLVNGKIGFATGMCVVDDSKTGTQPTGDDPSTDCLLLACRTSCFYNDHACTSFIIHHQGGSTHYKMDGDFIKLMKFELHYLMCLPVRLNGRQQTCLPLSILLKSQAGQLYSGGGGSKGSSSSKEVFVSGYFNPTSRSQLERGLANRLPQAQAWKFCPDPMGWQNRQIEIVHDSFTQQQVPYGYAGCVVWNDTGIVGMTMLKVTDSKDLLYADINDMLAVL